MKNNTNRNLIVLLISFMISACDDNPIDSIEIEQTSLRKSVHAFGINSDGDIFAAIGSGFGNPSIGGVYRSTSNGDSWTEVITGSGRPTNSIAINSGGDIFAGSSKGVIRSTDNGQSWTEVNAGLLGSSVNSLVINLRGEIYAGTWSFTNGPGPVFRSSDNGESWIEVNNGLKEVIVNSLVINSDGDIFAAGIFRSVYRSTDNGDSWIAVNDGLDNNLINDLTISSDGNIFAASTFFSFAGVYRSTNNGDSWAPVFTGNVSTLGVNFSGHIFAGTDCTAFFGRDCEEGGGYGQLFGSTNNGNSWKEINSDWTANHVYSISVNSAGYIFIGTDSGVYRSVESTDSSGESLMGY